MIEPAMPAAGRRAQPRRILAAALACALFAPLATVPAQNPPAGTAPLEMPEPVREDLSFPLPAGMPIEVDNPYGSVFIRFGGYEHNFDMHTTLQQPAGAAKIAFAPAAKDGRFLVAPRLPEGVVLAEGQRLDIVLYIPQKHALSARTEIGAIESRGVKSDLTLRSRLGDITIRGTEGLIDAQTDEGRIEVIVTETAPQGSQQRLVSRTGSVLLSTTDKLDAEVRMSTSQTFATDFSLTVEHLDGQEPNKRAVAAVGSPKPGKQQAVVLLESLAGEIRLQRRAVFVEPE